MSTMFQYPHAPIIGPTASPRDQSGDSTDYPFLGVYTSESTQRYVYGTRYITWDGRVFKYAYTSGAVNSYNSVSASEDAALGWTTVAATASIGDTSVTCTLASRSEDDLAGGYIELYDNTTAIATSNLRGIVGNDASVSSTLVVYVDSPLHQAMTATDVTEIYENPYRLVTYASSNAYHAHIGVPARNAATDQNIWIQTWGPCLISPGNNTLDDPAYDERQVYFGANEALFEAASTATSESQHAGFILNADPTAAGGIAGPLIMLQISI